jgi:hypothetical protein
MRRYLVFVTASLSLLMYTIDSTAVAVAFPNFIRDLHTDVLWAGWTMSIFSIGVCMAMPLAGNLADSFGRKRVFLISLIFFTGSSLAGGFAPNIYALIACRLLQGIGGASFLPTASGIVTDQFPESRQTVIGLFSSVFNVGSIIGPNLGGWIVSRYSWRYIFYINVPIGLGLMVLTLMLLKDSKVFYQRHIDFVGASLMSGTILFLMFGLNVIGESFSLASLLCAAFFILLSLFLALSFLRQESDEPRPRSCLVAIKTLCGGKPAKPDHRRWCFGALCVHPPLRHFRAQALHVDEWYDTDTPFLRDHSRLGDHQLSAQAVGLPVAHGVGPGHCLLHHTPSCSGLFLIGNDRQWVGSSAPPLFPDPGLRHWFGNYDSRRQQRVH